MEFFYSDSIYKNKIVLDINESRHCLKVLRKKIDDDVDVVDGRGNLYNGQIISFENNKCQIEIKNKHENYDQRKHYIHIAISPIKSQNRIEWFIEKSVELGIDEISFVQCGRTLKKTIKIDRLYKTAIVAMKQTLKATIPKINNIIKINDFLENCKEKNRYICHLENSLRKSLFSFDEKIINNKNCILVGPEGDFTIDEINRSEKYQFQPITLGNSRLRTETAGVVACHLLNIINDK